MSNSRRDPNIEDTVLLLCVEFLCYVCFWLGVSAFILDVDTHKYGKIEHMG